MALNRDKTYVTTFSVKKEFKEPLREGLKTIGLESYGDLASMVALHGEEMAEVLGPLVARYMGSKTRAVSEDHGKRGKGKVTLAAEKILDSASDADELDAALAELGLLGKTP